MREGRIRGQGITENTPPTAPDIPPASEVAGVPNSAHGAASAKYGSRKCEYASRSSGVPFLTFCSKVPHFCSRRGGPHQRPAQKAQDFWGGGVARRCYSHTFGSDPIQKAVEGRYKERAKKREGYVPRDAPSGEGILYDLAAWVIDPFGNADKSVGVENRSDFSMWRANLRSINSTKKPGEVLSISWDIGKCDVDPFGNQNVEPRQIIYLKQSDGKWTVKEGNASGTPDVNDIISEKVSDEYLKGIIMADPCVIKA